MPRRPRVVIPGLPHHITQRGNNRQAVFQSFKDRRLYLSLLIRHAVHYEMQILGYCLMTNHVHLIAAPANESSLARTLARTHSEYALSVNRSGERTGHLWQNRFFSCPLDQVHLDRALLYVEMNPVRAGLVEQPWDWLWSSARAHVSESYPDSVIDGRWIEHFGHWDYADWKERLQFAMSESEREAIRHSTNTGAPLGSQEFVTRLEQQAGKRLSVRPRGRPLTKKASDPFSWRNGV